MRSSSHPEPEPGNGRRGLSLSRKSSDAALLIGLVMAALFVVLDIFIECHMLPDTRLWIDQLLHPEPSRFWSRIAGISIIILLGVASLLLLRRHENAEAKLEHSSFMLQEMTAQLQEKNAILNKEIGRRERVEKELETLAVTDQLTGIFNRRKFDEILRMHIRQELRYPKGLALLMLDLDHFKSVNDRFGHSTGDEVLKEFVRVVQAHKREADDLFRVGGEEFCLITFCSNGGSLQTTAEKICRAIDAHEFPTIGHLTVSVGVTHFVPGDSYDTLFKRVDDALYLAKQQGRNQVVVT